MVYKISFELSCTKVSFFLVSFFDMAQIAGSAFVKGMNDDEPMNERDCTRGSGI